MLLGIDVSHYQGAPDFARVKETGRQFVVIKATQGSDYVDPRFVANRKNAAAAGLVVGLYHYATNTDPVAEAEHFLKTVGTLGNAEFLALDWEVAGSNPVGWCLAFLRRVEADKGVKPLVYLNHSLLFGHNWSSVASGGFKLWLALYDQSTAAAVSGNFGVVTIKQYSDSGVIPGIYGQADLDVFYGDLDALKNLGRAPKPAPAKPAPKPAPSGNSLPAHAPVEFGVVKEGAKHPVNQAVQAIVGVEQDGNIGPITVEAVKKWQKANGLAEDGEFGPASARKAIEDAGILKVGVEAPAVSLWQHVAGVNTDRKFGAATETATREVQEFCKVVVDGEVGAETVNAAVK